MNPLKLGLGGIVGSTQAAQGLGGIVGSAQAAQDFLSNRVQQITKPETLEQLGYMKAHPALGIVHGVSKATGGPGLTEGFRQGVINDKAEGRDGNWDLQLPPMPF